MGKRIIVTGGSGKAGQYVIDYLLDQGHQVLNLDLTPLPAPFSDRVHTIRVDLADSGQVYSAFTSHFKLTEPFREPLDLLPDALIHLAGYSRNMIVPDNETFRGNALSTYNVIEAACRLGIKKIVTASSVTVYGVSYAEGDVDYPSFPVHEEVDTHPMDTYAISKVCGERIARGFARRFGTDIYVLRIGPVVAPHEYKGTVFDSYIKTPEKWAAHGWGYTDARDLGQMCDLAVQKDGLKFQIFNAVNDEITNYTPSAAGFLARVCPDVPHTREMDARETPCTNKKMKEVLGFRQNHPWQTYYET
ncbi:nascent polypeptide-associated complex subunit beta [Penicillium atrosanguineum]|uniref:nascent polypeptide-associated complex subunit beta n=1 Tax=Penicillium atrosanguineum TaxID=1132637 RepID=UPI0023A681E5|nr:nascent polypeptide-associated complex subunit beta [Penicillium atrosanguineum]KAJ5298277.1 nascent polypeptide-associated complex subunit beta [Penicillium atrosanguineum]